MMSRDGWDREMGRKEVEEEEEEEGEGRKKKDLAGKSLMQQRSKQVKMKERSGASNTSYGEKIGWIE